MRKIFAKLVKILCQIFTNLANQGIEDIPPHTQMKTVNESTFKTRAY